MPPKTNKRRHNKKPFLRAPRRNYQANRLMRGSSSLNVNRLFPSRITVPFEFQAEGGIGTGTTQSAIGTGTSLYYLNCIVRPLQGSNNCVQGYDQIKDIYEKYKVIRTKVEVIFNNPSSDGIWCAVRGLRSAGSDALAGEYIDLASMKKWTVCKPINDSGSQVVKYTRMWDIKDMEGLTPAQFNGDLTCYNSSMNTQPTCRPYLEVGVANSQSTTDRTINYKVKLTMYTQLYDRRVLANSVLIPV